MLEHQILILKTSKIIQKLLILFFCCLFIVSCGYRSNEEAIHFFDKTIKNKGRIFLQFKDKINKLLLTEDIVLLTTKPGSHILNVDCGNCIELTKISDREIADFIDSNSLRYIKIKKGHFISFALNIRNEESFYYLATYLENISDTNKINKCIYEKDNWVLVSPIDKNNFK